MPVQYNDACFLRAGLFGVELEETYQVGPEGRARLFDLGSAGGSNAFWDAATLKVVQRPRGFCWRTSNLSTHLPVTQQVLHTAYVAVCTAHSMWTMLFADPPPS